MGAEAVGTVIGNYRIESVLGVGATSTVYRARHPRLPRSDALKVLSPSAVAHDSSALDRFERESVQIASLTHPNIVRVYDSGTDSGQPWLSMELIDGTDALGLLREHPDGLPLSMTADLVDAIAEALTYSHSKGVQHRDVKPSNILIDRARSTVRYALGDFGIALAATDPRLTQTGTVLGTVDYCSPEQIADQPLDGSADQYSLAATAVHLLSGQRPYGKAGVATIAHRQLTAPAPRPSELRPGLPPAVDTVIAKAMSKEPENRYASCRDFASAFAVAILELPHEDERTGTGSEDETARRQPLRRARATRVRWPVRTRVDRRRWVRATSAVAAIAAVAVIAIAAEGMFGESGPAIGTGVDVAAGGGDQPARSNPGSDPAASAPSGVAPPRSYQTDPGHQFSDAQGAEADATAITPFHASDTSDPTYNAARPESGQRPDDPERAVSQAPSALASGAVDYAAEPGASAEVRSGQALDSEEFTVDNSAGGAMVPAPPATTAAGSGTGRPSMRTAAGLIDPCRIPASVLAAAGLEEINRGTAPAPILDCFARLKSDPNRTVELAFYPFDAVGREAIASRTAYEHAPATESGWRAYRTSVVVLGDRYVYCALGRMVPGAGLFEIYTLSGSLEGSPSTDEGCLRLSVVADALIKEVGTL